jgi:hypothetical protein
MAEIVDIYDGGTMVDEKGHKIDMIIFRVSFNEGPPENVIANCLPNCRESVINNPGCLAFQKEK